MTFLNATMLILVQTEIFIVTTSLVAITEDQGDFDAASWILESYFLGYVSKHRAPLVSRVLLLIGYFPGLY